MYDKLEQIRTKRHLARVTRSGQSADHDHGFILGVSPTLVLYQNEEDFVLNGCSVVRLQDITAVRSGRYDRYFQRMMREEDLISEVGLANALDLTDWRTLLRGLKQLGRHVIIECEVGDAVLDEFYIGRLERVNPTSVSLRHFDALGWWDAAPTRVELGAITRVRFGERYIEIFSKHLRWR